ncbi:Condensin subunit 1/Condensin-2 complex subunit D3 like protein, partial [Aduncisulcus paluster]
FLVIPSNSLSPLVSRHVQAFSLFQARVCSSNSANIASVIALVPLQSTPPTVGASQQKRMAQWVRTVVEERNKCTPQIDEAANELNDQVMDSKTKSQKKGSTSKTKKKSKPKVRKNSTPLICEFVNLMETDDLVNLYSYAFLHMPSRVDLRELVVAGISQWAVYDDKFILSPSRIAELATKSATESHSQDDALSRDEFDLIPMPHCAFMLKLFESMTYPSITGMKGLPLQLLDAISWDYIMNLCFKMLEGHCVRVELGTLFQMEAINSIISSFFPKSILSLLVTSSFVHFSTSVPLRISTVDCAAETAMRIIDLMSTMEEDGTKEGVNEEELFYALVPLLSSIMPLLSHILIHTKDTSPKIRARSFRQIARVIERMGDFKLLSVPTLCNGLKIDSDRVADLNAPVSKPSLDTFHLLFFCSLLPIISSLIESICERVHDVKTTVKSAALGCVKVLAQSTILHQGYSSEFYPMKKWTLWVHEYLALWGNEQDKRGSEEFETKGKDEDSDIVHTFDELLNKSTQEQPDGTKNKMSKAFEGTKSNLRTTRELRAMVSVQPGTYTLVEVVKHLSFRCQDASPSVRKECISHLHTLSRQSVSLVNNIQWMNEELRVMEMDQTHQSRILHSLLAMVSVQPGTYTLVEVVKHLSFRCQDASPSVRKECISHLHTLSRQSVSLVNNIQWMNEELRVMEMDQTHQSYDPAIKLELEKALSTITALVRYVHGEYVACVLPLACEGDNSVREFAFLLLTQSIYEPIAQRMLVEDKDTWKQRTKLYSQFTTGKAKKLPIDYGTCVLLNCLAQVSHPLCLTRTGDPSVIPDNFLVLGLSGSVKDAALRSDFREEEEDLDSGIVSGEDLDVQPATMANFVTASLEKYTESKRMSVRGVARNRSVEKQQSNINLRVDELFFSCLNLLTKSYSASIIGALSADGHSPTSESLYLLSARRSLSIILASSASIHTRTVISCVHGTSSKIPSGWCLAQSQRYSKKYGNIDRGDNEMSWRGGNSESATKSILSQPAAFVGSLSNEDEEYLEDGDNSFEEDEDSVHHSSKSSKSSSSRRISTKSKNLSFSSILLGLTREIVKSTYSDKEAGCVGVYLLATIASLAELWGKKSLRQFAFLLPTPHALSFFVQDLCWYVRGFHGCVSVVRSLCVSASVCSLALQEAETEAQDKYEQFHMTEIIESESEEAPDEDLKIDRRDRELEKDEEGEDATDSALSLLSNLKEYSKNSAFCCVSLMEFMYEYLAVKFARTGKKSSAKDAGIVAQDSEGQKTPSMGSFESTNKTDTSLPSSLRKLFHHAVCALHVCGSMSLFCAVKDGKRVIGDRGNVIELLLSLVSPSGPTAHVFGVNPALLAQTPSLPPFRSSIRDRSQSSYSNMPLSMSSMSPGDLLKSSSIPTGRSVLTPSLLYTPGSRMTPVGSHRMSESAGFGSPTSPSASLSSFSGSNSLPSALPLAASVRSHALLALCECGILSRSLAERVLPLLCQLVVKSQCPVIRSNCVLGIADLICTHGAVAETYADVVGDCVGDVSLFVRRQAVAVLSSLIAGGYLQWKSNLFFAFLPSLADPDPELSSFTLYALGQSLGEKTQDAIMKNFVQVFFVLNNCRGFGFNSFHNELDERRVAVCFNVLRTRASETGIAFELLKRRIYFTLLSMLTPAGRFDVINECLTKVITLASMSGALRDLKICENAIHDVLLVVGEEHMGVKHLTAMFGDDVFEEGEQQKEAINLLAFLATKKAAREVLPLLTLLLENLLKIKSPTQTICVNVLLRLCDLVGKEGMLIVKTAAPPLTFGRLKATLLERERKKFINE